MTSSPSKLFINGFNEKPLEYLGCISLDGFTETVPPSPELLLYKTSSPYCNFYMVTVRKQYLGIVDEIDMFNLKVRMTKEDTITITLYRPSGSDFLFEGYSILDKCDNEIFRAIQIRKS